MLIKCKRCKVLKEDYMFEGVYVNCITCRETKRKLKKEVRDKNYLRGLCMCCSRPREDLLKTACNYCLRSNKVRDAERRSKHGTDKVQPL